MDTMFFYFEIDEIRCRKHSNLKRREKYKEMTVKENIHSKVSNKGAKNE